MSTIAVFVALGGTSYAVARNSIGTPQLKNNAVTSTKVKNGSLLSGDLAPSARVGQRGPRGPQGPAGASAGNLQPEAWKPLEFSGTWGNYELPVTSKGEFRKDAGGVVHLRGTVTQRAGAPARVQTIAVLPPGYRPLLNEIFETASQGDGPAQVAIQSDGSIIWIAGLVTDSDFTTLDGITFYTD